ncbi:TPA: hypothetical protein ENS27_01145, partial [bacterium]|nr:hypothetical protein [bacterium]
QLGIPIIFGDGSVPDMIEQLPLSKIRWVVCTIRNNEVIASIINHLRQAGYNGLIACTAQSASDEQFLRSLKVNEIFLPFADAAEQAAESITGPSHLFQNISEWPVEIKEISLHPGSIFTGKKLNEIPLRRELGVSVAAISRAGFTYINPSPDFQLMPRDRLALIGNPASVDQALAFLDAKQFPGETDNTASPVMEEINVSMHPDWTGKTIVELNLRAVYDIMIISMRRKNIWTTPPHPDEKLLPDDSLLVFGRAESIEKIRNTTS